MSRILILGSEGQIGTELSIFLSNIYSKSDIITADLNKKTDTDFEFIKLNALSYSNIENVVKKYEVDDVYHLVAILSAKGEENPLNTWEVNMTSLFNVLELARKKLIKKVFWPSSISVFGDTSPKNNTAQFSIKEPLTVYGISKLSGESWCEYYNNTYGTDVRSIRFPGIISSKTLPGGGTTDYAVSIFYSFIKKEVFKCFLNKGTKLPMIYIEDALRSIWMLMKADKNNLRIKSSYNLSAFSFTPNELYLNLQKRFKNFKIFYESDYRQKIADSWPNKINDNYSRKDWGWKPKYSFDEMVEEMIKKVSNKLNNE